MLHLANIGSKAAFSGVGGPLSTGFCSIPKTQYPKDILRQKLEVALAKFAPVIIECKVLDSLPAGDRAAVLKLVEVTQIIHEIFWRQTAPDAIAFRDSLAGSPDPTDKLWLKFLHLNAGPYDRIAGLKDIRDDLERPKGAGFYPGNILLAEIEKHAQVDASIKADNTVVLKTKRGGLISLPYTEMYQDLISPIVRKMQEAITLAADEKLKNLLRLCRAALLNNSYTEKDRAWVDYDGRIEFIFGIDERYEDRLLGLKGYYQAALLIKDPQETEKLDKILRLIMELQERLPVEKILKSKKVKLRLAVYNFLCGAGKMIVGPKTMGVSLPGDEEVRETIGQRVLQFKNIIEAKCRQILLPISNEVLVADQASFINEYAFYIVILLHEVSHALGIDYVVGKEKSEENKIRNVLGGDDKYNILEEAKADTVGLFSLSFLIENKIFEPEIENRVYISFVANLFRAARFGIGSAHGKAAMLQLNYLRSEENRAIVYQNGKVEVNIENMQKAVAALAKDLLEIEGRGDNDRAEQLIKKHVLIDPQTQQIIDRLAGIPVDLDYEFEVLNLIRR